MPINQFTQCVHVLGLQWLRWKQWNSECVNSNSLKRFNGLKLRYKMFILQITVLLITTDKSYKIRPLIDHFNAAFLDAFSDEAEQSIDDHITKFKGRSSMRQYLQLKRASSGGTVVSAVLVTCMSLIYI